MNPEYATAVATILVGFVAFVVYRTQRADQRRDTAKTIVQEIRRAEKILEDYKQTRNFKFTQKIIATNSWAKSVNMFVDVLDVDEIDKISNLYSTGEFLDSLIRDVYEFKFDQAKKELQHPELVQLPFVGIQQGQPGQSAQMPPAIQLQMIPFWQMLSDEIVSGYEPIYHTSIVRKLKDIANLK